MERIQLHSNRDREINVRDNFGEEDGGVLTQKGSSNLPEERDRRRRQRDRMTERPYIHTTRRPYNRTTGDRTIGRMNSVQTVQQSVIQLPWDLCPTSRFFSVCFG